jgi:transcriptional regulator with XRE-family HTH domain
MEIASLAEQMLYVREQIKQIRKQQDVSQLELSSRANLSQSFLANLENGKKQPSVLTLIRIAKALDVNPRDFFPITEPKLTDTNDTPDSVHVKEEIIRLVGLL